MCAVGVCALSPQSAHTCVGAYLYVLVDIRAGTSVKLTLAIVLTAPRVMEWPPTYHTISIPAFGYLL